MSTLSIESVPGHPDFVALRGQDHVDNRRLLREVMREAGWSGINTEWWHFDGGDRERIRAEYLRVL